MTVKHSTDNGGSTAQQNIRPVPAKAGELLNDQSNGLPVWIRSPKNGVEFYAGFSGAVLCAGAGKEHFGSVSIRGLGQVKGTRLFHLALILTCIEKRGQKQRRKKSRRRLQPLVPFLLRTMEFIYWLFRHWCG